MSSCRRDPAPVRSSLLSNARRAAGALLLALAASSCVSDPAAPVAQGGARLALAARVAAADADAIGVSMWYARRVGGPAPLHEATIPIPAGSSPGATLAHPLTLELGPCLADPEHLPGGDACTVLTTLRLLRGSQLLDEQVLPAMEIRPGQTASPEPVVLSEVSGVQIAAPGGEARVFRGETLQLTGRPTGRGGDAVDGRSLAWSSSAPGVVSVDQTGLVRGVEAGSAVIRAEAGGRSGELTVVVDVRPVIVLGATTAAFTAAQGGAAPAGQEVMVTGSVGDRLPGLALDDVAYEGSESGWLQAALTFDASPARIRLVPTRTDLPVGTHAATLTVRATDALPQTVRVTYTVAAPVVLGVSRSRVELRSEGELPAAETFTVTGAPGVTGATTAAVEYLTPERDWLELSVAPAGPAGAATVRVEATQLLHAGVHEADVVLTAPGVTRPTRVRVSYTVDVDYSDYFLHMYPMGEEAGALYYAGDSIWVEVFLGAPDETEATGVPITITSSHPHIVAVRPGTITSGGGFWAVATASSDTSQMYTRVYFTATVGGHEFSDSYWWLYYYGYDWQPELRVGAPNAPRPALRTSPSSPRRPTSTARPSPARRPSASNPSSNPELE